MLDLTVPMVEVWFAGAKLGEYTSDVEALKAASLHADSLPLIAESVEYELRRDTMKYIVHRRITGPDAPALGPVLTISSSALTVTLDRSASGPTRIDRYELERYSGSAWVQIASGLSIFGASNQYADSSLTASTAYQYRARAVDTTERASEYSYSSGTTSAGETNQAPVWQSGTIAISIQAGSSVDLTPYCSDPEGDQITYTLLDTNPNDATISVSQSGVLQTMAATTVGANSVIVRASDGSLTANKTIALTVTAVSSGQTFNILTGAATYDASQVQPGDTIIINADINGERGPLKIINCTGASGNPIYIKNPSGTRVTIRKTDAATTNPVFVFDLNGVNYVEIDGSNGMSAGQYGIRVMYAKNAGASNKDRPKGWIQFRNRSRNVTIKYCEVNGGYPTYSLSGAGIVIGDSALQRSVAANYGLWWENYLITRNYIHGTRNSGMYLGPNFSDGELPLRNIEVSYNTIEDIGYTGMTCKCWWEGTNSIHDNVIDTTGLVKDGTAIQREGINLLSGTASIYNNKIFNVGDGQATAPVAQSMKFYVQNGPLVDTTFQGFGPYSEFPLYVYNNLIVNGAKVGITVGRTNTSVVPPVPYIYNNTVTQCSELGITTSDTGGGFVRNNVVIGNNNGGTQISSSLAVAGANKIIGTVGSVFEAPTELLTGSYALLSAVPVWGTSSGVGTDIATPDIVGTARTLATADQGAYEKT